MQGLAIDNRRFAAHVAQLSLRNHAEFLIFQAALEVIARWQGFGTILTAADIHDCKAAAGGKDFCGLANVCRKHEVLALSA